MAGAAGFRWLFWIDAVSSVIFAVLVWRAVPETRTAERESAGGFGVVLRDRVMVAFTLVVLGQALVYMQTVTMLPVAMVRQVGLSTGEFGVAMALNGVLIVIVQPLVSDWIGRVDAARTLALGLADHGGRVRAHRLRHRCRLAGRHHRRLDGGRDRHGGHRRGPSSPRWRPRTCGGGTRGCSGSRGRPPRCWRRWPAGRLLDVGPQALWFTVGGVGLLSAVAMLALGPAIRRRALVPAL